MATRIETLAEIEALETHCRAPLMTTDARARWIADWCNDLAAFDVETVRAAFWDWRLSGATKFPTPGQIIPMIRAKQPIQRSGEKNGPWRELSDREYDALSLRDKARHQRILAAEARRKAGPMFKNTSHDIRNAAGNFIAPQDMPNAWRRWQEIADHHEAEAKRLTKIIRDAERGGEQAA